LIHRDAFGFGVEGGDEAVAEGRGGEGLNVVDGDVRAALKKGAHFAGEDEHLAGTRAGTPTEHAFHILRGGGFIRARGADEVEHEIDDVIRHGHFTRELLRGLEVLGGDDGIDVLRIGAGGAGNDVAFVVARGVIHFDKEKEAVFLRFGQGIGAFLLDGVLRGEHEEGLRKLEGFLADRDVLFLHRLQQSGLSLRRRAVDFVGEDDLAENRAALENKLSAAGFGVFLDDFRAGDVRGHQIGRELDAAEAEVHRVGKRFDQQRLREAGNAFEEAMTARSDGDEDLLDDGLLSHDAPGERGFELLEIFDEGGGGGSVGHGREKCK